MRFVHRAVAERVHRDGQDPAARPFENVWLTAQRAGQGLLDGGNCRLLQPSPRRSTGLRHLPFSIRVETPDQARPAFPEALERLYEAVDDLLGSRFVEIDLKALSVHGQHLAVAEFLVKDPVTHVKFSRRFSGGDDFGSPLEDQSARRDRATVPASGGAPSRVSPETPKGLTCSSLRAVVRWPS